MKCPACQKDESLQSADGWVCKCGYAFSGPQTNSFAVVASIERMLRTVKGILVFWCWLTIIGIVLGLIWFVATR
jgi:hypothetical protein